MIPTPPALAYRRAATQQASVIGLVIALYDTLAGDLHRAVAAMQRNDIENRCQQLKHGFTVLTQLDSLIDTERGGHAAVNLRRFYGHIREEMLRAQFTQDSSILERLSTMVLDVRGAWQEVDMRAATPPVLQGSQGPQGSAEPLSGIEYVSFNCTA